MAFNIGGPSNDNSTKILQWTDSLNHTDSWAQTLSDMGNITVDVNKPSNAIQTLMPAIVVGLIVIALVAIFRPK
jgi:CHASE3 domain sensor protein